MRLNTGSECGKESDFPQGYSFPISLASTPIHLRIRLCSMRLAAIMLLVKEQAFVEASVRAIYPVVESICGTSRHDRNFSGGKVVPDQTLSVLLQIPDPDDKIKLPLLFSANFADCPSLNPALEISLLSLKSPIFPTGRRTGPFAFRPLLAKRRGQPPQRPDTKAMRAERERAIPPIRDNTLLRAASNRRDD